MPSRTSRKEFHDTPNSPSDEPDSTGDFARPLEEVVDELKAHRLELEMQNRALQETRSELEETLRLSSDLYDHLPIGYVTLTPQGRIIQANLTAAKWLRRRRENLAGAYLRAFLPAFDAGRFTMHLEFCSQSEDACAIDLALETEDGAPMPVQFSSRRAPVSRAGATKIHTAISMRLKATDTQRALDGANREIAAFDRAIFHELYGALNTIRSSAHCALGESIEPGKRTALLQRVETETSRTQETLRKLREYVNLRRQTMTHADVDLEHLVERVHDSMSGLIKERRAEVIIERPLPGVHGSSLALAQVLTNLLTNALTFVAPDRPPKIRVSASRQGSFVVLRVIDNGIGIPLDEHERIFGLFECGSIQSACPGAGIGLAIVRSAAERMQGRVWVESTPREGSCFCVELPKSD
ncbi:MAG: Phytochrome-like protein cph1 [Verrucomicrobiota bacterium]|jgi:signal transduction histidine kinase